MAHLDIFLHEMFKFNSGRVLFTFQIIDLLNIICFLTAMKKFLLYQKEIHLVQLSL
jgi:hypothetical protein